MKTGRHQKMCGYNPTDPTDTYWGCGDTMEHGILDVPIGMTIKVRIPTGGKGWKMEEFKVTSTDGAGVTAWMEFQS